MLCQHCKYREAKRSGILCHTCYKSPRGLRQRYMELRHEPSEQELETIIAEQAANLPAWWNDPDE